MSTARNMLQRSSSIWKRNTEPLGNKLVLIIFRLRILQKEKVLYSYFQRIIQIPVCRDDAKSGFILEIIDGRELPEYMTMNKG